MTKNQLNTYLASILTTLRDLNTGCPESTCYMAMGMDMSGWITVKMVLLQADLVTCNGNWVDLTDAGKVMADKINAVMVSAK